MLRSVAVLGALAALAVSGCGDDDQFAAVQTTATVPVTAPPAAVTAPAPAETRPVPVRPPATQPSSTSPAEQPPTSTQPLEVPREQVVAQSRERARKARQSGALTCEAIGRPDAGVVDITAKGVSCATARRIISSTDRDAKRGFACEITSESFADVPTVAFACERSSDGARIAYTAVG